MSTSTRTRRVRLGVALSAALLCLSCSSSPGGSPDLVLRSLDSDDEVVPAEVYDSVGSDGVSIRTRVPGTLTVSVSDELLDEYTSWPLAMSAQVFDVGGSDIAVVSGVLRLIDGCVVAVQREADGGVTGLLFNPITHRWDAEAEAVIRVNGYDDGSVRHVWPVEPGTVDERYDGGSPTERYLGGRILDGAPTADMVLGDPACALPAGTVWAYVE